MAVRSDQLQDLQLFISRAGGAAPNFGLELPTMVSAGAMRDFSAPSRMSGSTSATTVDGGFPSYVGVANSEAVESIQIPFSPQEVISILDRLAGNEIHLRECVEFGAVLFDAVFHRSIRDKLRSLTAKGQTLRLTIATSAPELLILPWEILCDTEFGVLPRFISHRPEIRLCRSLRLFNRAEFEHLRLGGDTLRVLLVTASPDGLERIDTRTEEAMLRFVLDEPPQLRDVELSVLHNATVNTVRKRLGELKPHVVHVSCHGTISQKEGLGFLALCSEDRSGPDLVNSFRFASLISEPRSVQFVFVSTCHGAAQHPLATFSGVAECLHANGVQAVVALQFTLLDPTGHAIALNFYRHLLRDRLSVEDCVSQVRQYLFLGNHLHCETFGLSFFQRNSSLFRDVTGAAPVTGAAKSYEDFARSFEEQLNQRAIEKLSAEFEQFAQTFADLTMLSASDFALAIRVFDNQTLAADVLRAVRQAQVPLTPFLKMARVALALCHCSHEHSELVTALALYAYDDVESSWLASLAEISEQLPSGFFFDDTKRMIGEAIKVNGVDRLFAAFASPDGAGVVHEHIRSLNKLADSDPSAGEVLGDPKWKRVFAAARGRACAFILPGLGRIKVIVDGSQIAEYRSGRWSYASLAELKQQLAVLAAESSIDLGLLIDVVQKALVTSDLGKGRTFVLVRKDGIPPTLKPGYKDITLASDGSELKGKSIVQFEPHVYLMLIEGDGAAVLSYEGHTLAVNAQLAPRPDTQVTEPVSQGARHTSAQQITMESDTVAVVISDDGPITVFFRGRPVFRSL